MKSRLYVFRVFRQKEENNKLTDADEQKQMLCSSPLLDSWSTLTESSADVISNTVRTILLRFCYTKNSSNEIF